VAGRRLRDGLVHFTADSDAHDHQRSGGAAGARTGPRSPQEILATHITFIDRIGLREHLSPTAAMA
jgi:sulfur transfer protein SufE